MKDLNIDPVPTHQFIENPLLNVSHDVVDGQEHSQMFYLAEEVDTLQNPQGTMLDEALDEAEHRRLGQMTSFGALMKKNWIALF